MAMEAIISLKKVTMAPKVDQNDTNFPIFWRIWTPKQLNGSAKLIQKECGKFIRNERQEGCWVDYESNRAELFKVDDKKAEE